MILLANSVACFLNLVTNIPYVIHYYIRHSDKSIFVPDPERDTKAWTLFLKVHIISSITFHTISVWLTVYLSCFRFVYLKLLISKPSLFGTIKCNEATFNNKNIQKKSFLLNFTGVRIIILIIYCLGLLFALPVYLYSSINQNFYNKTINTNQTKIVIFYCLEPSELNLSTNDFLFNIMVYSQVFLGKLMPCFLIILFTSLTIKKIVIIKLNKKLLLTRRFAIKHKKPKETDNVVSYQNQIAEISSLGSVNHLDKNSLKLNLIRIHKKNNLDKEKTKINDKTPLNQKFLYTRNNFSKINHMRTTVMLVAICSLFIVVEIPITVLTLLSLSEEFYTDVFVPLAELMDLSMMIYSSINLILMLSMSATFRMILNQVVKEYLNVVVLFFKKCI